MESLTNMASPQDTNRSSSRDKQSVYPKDVHLRPPLDLVSDSEESFTMSENAPPSTAIGTDDDPTRGMPYHDKVTQDLKAMLQKKRQLERSVVCEQKKQNKSVSFVADYGRCNMTRQFTRRRLSTLKKHRTAIFLLDSTTISRVLLAQRPVEDVRRESQIKTGYSQGRLYVTMTLR